VTEQRDDRAIERIRAVRSGDDWAALLRRIALHPNAGLDAVLGGSGRPPPGAPAPVSAAGVPARLWDALAWLARRHGFTVTRASCGAAGGLTDWTGRHIMIDAEAGSGCSRDRRTEQRENRLPALRQPPSCRGGSPYANRLTRPVCQMGVA